MSQMCKQLFDKLSSSVRSREAVAEQRGRPEPAAGGGAADGGDAGSQAVVLPSALHAPHPQPHPPQKGRQRPRRAEGCPQSVRQSAASCPRRLQQVRGRRSVTQ